MGFVGHMKVEHQGVWQANKIPHFDVLVVPALSEPLPGGSSLAQGRDTMGEQGSSRPPNMKATPRYERLRGGRFHVCQVDSVALGSAGSTVPPSRQGYNLGLGGPRDPT